MRSGVRKLCWSKVFYEKGEELRWQKTKIFLTLVYLRYICKCLRCSLGMRICGLFGAFSDCVIQQGQWILSLLGVAVFWRPTTGPYEHEAARRCIIHDRHVVLCFCLTPAAGSPYWKAIPFSTQGSMVMTIDCKASSLGLEQQAVFENNQMF